MEASDQAPKSSLLLLDACCAINLLASGLLNEIVAALAHDVAVARHVLEQEVLHVRSDAAVKDSKQMRAGAQDEEVLGESRAPPANQITLQPLADRGRIQVLEPSTDDEQQTFVDLALQLDDGEAVTGALAIHRRAAVATDDKKAIRVLTERDPILEIRRTSELVKEWSEVWGVPDGEVGRVLLRIEEQANFVPPGDDPLREWWMRMRGTGEG